MTSAKFWDFFPPPFVRIWDWSTVLNSRNLPFYIFFWANPPPPLSADVICGCPLSWNQKSPLLSVGHKDFFSYEDWYKTSPFGLIRSKLPIYVGWPYQRIRTWRDWFWFGPAKNWSYIQQDLIRGRHFPIKLSLVADLTVQGSDPEGEKTAWKTAWECA